MQTSQAATFQAGTARTGVLTFHRCINYGSYWQARCLVEGLRALGEDAVLLDHESPQVTWAEWRCALRPTLPAPTSRTDFPAYAAKTREFLGAFDALPSSRRFALDRPEDAGAYGRIVVGSDEVWNLRHPWYGGRPIFFGDGLPARHLVSYAASFGNHDAADGLDAERARQLRGFAAISVRDENSRQIIRDALQVEAELVLDPCLQFPPEPGETAPDRAPYMALYGHGFPAWLIAEARRWAERNGLPIVSIGYRNDGADEQALTAGPDEFRRLIAGASAVVTNFFHGCVFALLNRKPLATAPSDYRFNKVRDLMLALDAREHMVSEDTDRRTFARLLAEPPAGRVYDRIDSLRRNSSDFLRHALALPA